MPSLRSFIRFAPALLVLWSDVALAGPVERMADIAVHPTNPDVIVVRYAFGGTGLLYSSDGGHNFSLLCASAIDSTRPKADGPVVVGSDSHVFVGTFDTLWEDNGKGCGWASVPEIKGRWTTDMTIDASDPTRLLAISGNGGEGVKNSIMRRDASGKWTEIGTQDPIGLTSVRTVKTQKGLRIYESALRVDPSMEQPIYLLRYSDDDGKTWTENPLPVPMKNGSFKLEAVDPSNPERVLVVEHHDKANDYLFLSRDAGKNFESYLEVSDLGALTFAP
ncbi:MAG TPA: hypothetical protein VJR89_21310, partial [Polyangiales bacterium]|nr:hypothetical protein [Polyangiales bacterium]